MKKETLTKILLMSLSCFSLLMSMNISSDNFFYILLIIPLIYIFFHKQNVDKRTNLFSLVLGLFSSLVFSLDIVVKRIYPLRTGNLLTLNRTIFFILIFIGFSALFYNLSKMLLNAINSYLVSNENKNSKRIFLMSFLIILICWIPYFLYNYPGILTVDSYYQIDQIAINQFSNWHPVAHTYFVKIFYDLGVSLFGSPMGGIAFFSIIQMLLMALVFALLITELYKRGVKKGICYLIVLYYALSPMHASYSVTLWKDVLFGIVALCLAINLLKLVEKPNNKKYLLSFTIISLIFTLFRSNSLYAFIIFLPFLVVYFKPYYKRFVLASLFVVISNILITGPLYKSLNITSAPITESLSIPLNQIARTITKGGNISLADKKYLKTIMAVDEIQELYNPTIADPIKNITNSSKISQNKTKFVFTWFHIMKSNFGTYTESFLLSTVGFWNPNEYDIPFAKTTPFEPYSTIYNIKNKNLLPKSLEFIFENNNKKKPLMQIFYSSGLMFYLLVCCFILALYKKSKYWILYLPFFGIWITIMIATPVSIQARYVYALFTFMPLCLALPFLNTKKEKDT